jgi:Golgi phosphoprotein 3
MSTLTSLTLAEELLLVALDDERGTLLPLPPFSMEVASAAALVMDLTLLGRIDTDEQSLTVISTAPTGNALLDEVLAQIAADSATRRPTADWMNRLATGTDTRDRIIAALVQRGVLQSVEKRLLWVFKTRVYPPTSGLEEREVKSRVMTLLNNEEIPDPRDSLLVGLLRGTTLLDSLLSRSERHRLAARIDQIADFEELNRSMSRTIGELQILLAAANMGMA